MAIPDLVLIGTATGASSILNQCMITRTPNGDLYASCGDMGQNQDLSTSHETPIIIWYSNDDGVTWVESLEIYVDSDTEFEWNWGGGGNGLCIASDSGGDVHVAFAIRRRGDHYSSPPGDIYCNNKVMYTQGKHGSWGSPSTIHEIDHEDYPLDALPKVTSLAVDSNEIVHILFSLTLTTSYHAVYHLWNPGSGTFSSELVHGDSHSVNNNRLVIDGNDMLHLTYGDDTAEKCYYKNKPSGGSWSSPVWLGMDSGPWYYAAVMAVDLNNNVHFAVADSGSGGKGYYRQRLVDGNWTDIEECLGVTDSPSISIVSDGTVYVAAHRTWARFYIKQRDPDSGTWSDAESWTEGSGGRGVCLLHSYYPISQNRHVCMLDTGWVFHWRPNHATSYYKLGGTFIGYGLVPGFIWAERTRIHFVDAGGYERIFEGVDTGVDTTAGYLWGEGTQLHYIDQYGDERQREGIKGGTTGVTPGQLWIEGTNLRYIDSSGDERYMTLGYLLSAGALGLVTFG